MSFIVGVYKKDGNLYYNGVDLKALALKYNGPLKICFLDLIENYIKGLKECFDKAIKKTGYGAKFIYLNANKANYGKEELECAYIHSDGLETSSYYDLLLTYEIYKRDPNKDKYIVCNGYKNDDYLDAILKINNDKVNIIDIIDSKEEYIKLKEKNVKLNVGLRVHLNALYSEDDVMNDRFGLMEDDILYILDDIKNTNLTLSTIHFHQRGMDFEEDKYLENLSKALRVYALAKKKNESVINLNIGGGTPLTDSTFDYDKWTNLTLTFIKNECEKNGISVPNLMSENGRFSQMDSCVNIYKIKAYKNTDEIPWALVDGSLLIAMPEVYALGEYITVCPIDHLDDEKIKVRLAGITCDCDDVYYDKKKGYFELPKNAEFIALLGTGSYQNSMNGKGGIHHCLLPEEIDLLSYLENGERKYAIRKNLQSFEDIMKLMKF